ncbi:MAG: hypothetical protein Q4D54_05595 [Eubacteriales bacterium]|nr:hypothetical protein [Lachnospiraceae bacterium]MDO5127207.1 hypothetical protein [Eubacteriales bacterium]
MDLLVNELVQYVIKFVAMLACAFLGIVVGKKLRKNKDAKEDI